MNIDLATKQPRRWAYLVGFCFFVLYTATAAPSIVELYDDSLEFQLVGPTFGIAHPTGYPLYVLLGALWSRVLLPVGNWAWRMNLFSALAAAGTVSLLFLLTQRFVDGVVRTKSAGAQSLWPGLAAAITFGLAPVWWQQATVAEVYALHSLFVVAILLVTFKLVLTPSPAPRLTLLFFLLGLGLTHHRTIVLLLPGIALMLWGQPGIWQPNRQWLRWGLAVLAPLLLYLWLPLRAALGGQDLHGSYVNNWTGFWDHVLARGYTSFFAPNALTVTRSARDWVQVWQAQVGLGGLVLGGVGMSWLGWHGRPWRLWVGLFVVLLTNLFFAVNYQVGDQEVFLLPAWLCFALLIGVGVYAVERLLQRWPRVAQGGAAIACLLLLLGVGGRGVMVNRRQDWAAHDYAVALAKVDFPPASRVIALEGQATALIYMQAAAGLGKLATPVIADTPPVRQAAVLAAMAQGYPTYLTQEVEGIAEHYSFSGEGPLVRVWPRGQANPGAPRHLVAQPFVDGALHLVGYDLEWLAEAGGPALRVAFYWRPTTQLTQVYKLSLRLMAGDVVLRQEDRYPLRLVAPTTSWAPGETVRDVHYLKTPVTATPQTTHLRVILYAEQNGAEVGTVDLPTLP